MKKSTLLKLSPTFLLISLLTGLANIAFADEKAAEPPSEPEKRADISEKNEAASSPAMNIDVVDWSHQYKGGLKKLASENLLNEDQTQQVLMLLSELVKISDNSELGLKFDVLSSLFGDYDAGLDLDYTQITSVFGIDEPDARRIVIESDLFGGDVIKMAEETIKGLEASEGNEENIKFVIEAAKTI